jgi:peptidoglycan/LPS O-acetylase OafA/YrhL
MTAHTAPEYRPDIDGLRALAIVPVVAYHAFPNYAPGGFVGVDIFFVISGYLISLIIFRGLVAGDFSFAGFYAHRIKRIFPALILVAGTCYAAGWFALLPEEFRQLGNHIAAGMGFVQNFVLWKEAGYFDVASELKPLMHLWSLAVEEQFYLVYPVLVWAAWKARLNVLTGVIVLGVVSFLLNQNGIDKDAVKTFFSPQTRFWELMAGAVLAYVIGFKAWRPSFTRRIHAGIFNRVIFREVPGEDERAALLASIVSWLGLALIVSSIALYDHTMPYPGGRAAVPVLGAVLLILAGPQAWVNRLVLSRKPVVWIGLVSYPLYLWHWPLLSFARIVAAGTPPLATRMAAVALSVLLAALTYYLVEKQVRHGRATYRKVAALCVLAIVVGYAGYNAYARGGLPFRVSQYALISEGLNDWTYPNGMQARESGGVGVYLNSPSDPEVLFFGDSHIEQYGPKVADLTLRGIAKPVAFMTGGGCPPVPFVHEDQHKNCAGLVDRFWQYLQQTPSVKTVVISGCFNCYFIYQAEPPTLPGDTHRYYFQKNAGADYFRGGNGKDAAIEEFAAFAKTIVAKGYRLYVVMDTPFDERFDPAKAVQAEGGGRPLLLTAKIKRYSPSFAIDPKQVALEQNLKTRLAGTGATVLDTADIICPNNVCSPLDKSGRPIYRDSNHMRPFFVTEKINILDAILSNK